MHTSRERQRIRHAPVDPHSRKGVVRDLPALDLAGEGDVPAISRQTDRHVHQPAPQGTCITEFDPANLGYTHGRPFAVQSSDLDFPALKPEGVVHAFLAGRGITRTAREKVGVGPIQIAQRLLLRRHMHLRDPFKLRPQRRQFTGLRNVVQASGRLTLVMSPPIAPLLKGKIIDQAHHARKLTKQGLLFRCRGELVAKGAMDHIANLAFGLRSATVDYRTGRHVLYMLHVHLVFVTKYRCDVLSEPAIRDLQHIFGKVCRDFEAELTECNGEDDHVHLLVHFPPKVALSKLVNSLKGVSSRLLREKRPEISGRYHNGVLWSPSYFAASCGGAPLSVVAEYVKSQRETSQGRSRVPPRPERRSIPRGAR